MSPRQTTHWRAAALLAAAMASLTAADKPRPTAPVPPRIATAQPIAALAGSNAVLLLRGQHLTNATEVRIRPPGDGPPLAASIRSRRKLDVGKNADALKLGDHQLEVSVALPAGTGPLTNRVQVLSPAGASEPLDWVVLPPSLVTREQEPNGGFAQAQSAPAGRTLLGAMQDPADVDVFRVAGRRGQPLVIRIRAAAGGSALDPVLTLHDARGRVLAMADDEGKQRDPVLRFLPASDGDFFVSVVDAYDRGGALYGYLLRVETAP